MACCSGLIHFIAKLWKVNRPHTPRYGLGVGVVDGLLYAVGGCDGYASRMTEGMRARKRTAVSLR